MANKMSVVICAYNEKRAKELFAAIASVRGQTLPPREIIVVVDHNPALLQQVRENCADVIAIENSKGKGASGARNSGWEKAQGEIIAFLDDDALAAPDWLENLALCYTNPNIVGVGGKLVPLWTAHCPSWFPEEFYWVIGCTHKGMPTGNAHVRNLIAANMSVRRDILLATEGFRESFGCDKGSSAKKTWKWLQHSSGDEETEFCIRVTQQIPESIWFYIPAAVVQHQVYLTQTRWSYFIWRCYDEGLGKASLVKLHSAQTGLSSEKTYTFKVLPQGAIRGLADVFLRRDLSGIARTWAIVVGLIMATLGYLIGRLPLQGKASMNIIPAPTHHFSA